MDVPPRRTGQVPCVTLDAADSARRSNLCQPADAYTDAEALLALNSCGLTSLAKPKALAEELHAEDLSLGEMQLLATARALIRQPKVLVFDEATAALDQASSDRLLAVIAKQTGDATVLSVAHRLSVVLQCDRILVLKRGGLLDIVGTPAALSQGDGYFARQLAAEAKE